MKKFLTLTLFALQAHADLPSVNDLVKQDLSKQVNAVANQYNKVKKMVEKEEYVLSSENQSILFLTNMVTQKQIGISSPIFQKSITYELQLDLKNAKIKFNTLFENDSFNQNGFIIPFNCAECEFEARIVKIDNNVESLTLSFVQGDDYNELKLIDKSYKELLSKLEFAKTLSIQTKSFPFGDEFFNFNIQ